MITLRPDQQAAIDAIVAVKRGIVKAPAGAGKTIIAAAALKRWFATKSSGSFVWYAHTMEQCAQGLSACREFGLAGNFVCYQAGFKPEAADVVVLDECHHIAAEEFRKILDGYKGVIWGFSATPERGDDLKDDVFSLIGPIVHTVERQGLVDTGKLLGAKVYFHAPNEKDEMKDFVEGEAEKGFEKMKYSLTHVASQISRQSIETVTKRLGVHKEALALGVEPDEPMSALSGPKKPEWLRAAAKIELMSRARWHACQTYGIFENLKRNGEIVRLANFYLFGAIIGPGGVRGHNKSILILVGSIEHGKKLATQIPTSVVVYSKMGVKKRKAAIQGFRDGSIKCVIATSLADEGLDVPRANVLILAAAGRSEGKTEQRTGRVLREFAEQTHGVIHDFWDHQHPLLMNQSRARARVYAGLKYEFAGGDAVQIALKSIGIKFHPLLNESGFFTKILRSSTTDMKPPEPVAPVEVTSSVCVESSEGSGIGVARRREKIDPAAQKLSKKTACGVPATQVDSGSLAPLADNPPLNTSLDCVATTGCKTAAEVVSALRERPLLPAPANITIERKHARLSPSTLKAKAICPGFINDPDGDKKAANRGTLGHKAVETNNPGLCGDDAQLRGAAERCIQYREKVRRAYLEPGDRRPYLQNFKEIRFEYFEQWGFCDEVWMCGGSADMLDWKFAYNFYEADAPQFWAYCLGAWNKWPQLETIKVRVVHPFLDAVDIEVFTRAQHFSDFQVKIKGVMAQANLNRPEDYRVTAQCAYCGFAGKCAKLAAVGVEIGRKYAPDLEVPDINFHGSEVKDADTMAALLRLAPVVLKAAGGWKKAGMEMWSQGTHIPGFKEVRKAGRRAVASAVEAYKIVKQFFAKDMKPEEFLAHCDVTVTGLDELVSATAPTGKKAQAVKELGARLEDADILTHAGGSCYLQAVKGGDDE